MTIPTTEIKALRDRAQEALSPVPYQKARLYIGLERDRPVRFAAVEVDSDLLACLVDESPHTFKGFELHPVQRVTGNWPAAQILELCETVLERRGQSLLRECIEYESPPDDVTLLPRSGFKAAIAACSFSVTRDVLKKAEAARRERLRREMTKGKW